MKTCSVLLFLLLLTAKPYAQERPAYQLYSAEGKKLNYGDMLRALKKSQIILFGEFHNNPLSHWLELQVANDLSQEGKLTMGAEMLEQDVQRLLDQYVAGSLSAKGLDSGARLWKNYPTDYAPLVNLAREKKLVFAATNVPRRYASLVNKNGFTALDTLSPEEKSWMAPLPIAYDGELPGYKSMTTMMPGHTSENLPKAQALKDATMAYFILKYYQPGNYFLHFNGAYHSENYEGILWYLKKDHPELKYTTITTISQKDISHLDTANKKKADFIICVPEDMTTTY
jgi:uncharacterized iron-regulated protein